jgi:hypothetical protein
VKSEALKSQQETVAGQLAQFRERQVQLEQEAAKVVDGDGSKFADVATRLMLTKTQAEASERRLAQLQTAWTEARHAEIEQELEAARSTWIPLDQVEREAWKKLEWFRTNALPNGRENHERNLTEQLNRIRENTWNKVNHGMPFEDALVELETAKKAAMDFRGAYYEAELAALKAKAAVIVAERAVHAKEAELAALLKNGAGGLAATGDNERSAQV